MNGVGRHGEGRGAAAVQAAQTPNGTRPSGRKPGEQLTLLAVQQTSHCMWYYCRQQAISTGHLSLCRHALLVQLEWLTKGLLRLSQRPLVVLAEVS